MGMSHPVQSGDCVSSIAFENGFFWQTLWDHPNNAELRTLRKDPNVLREGDSVYLPELTPKDVAGASGSRHKFKLKGVPGKLKLRLMLNDKPRANVPYNLTVAGQLLSGQTDADGKIEHFIPPDAKSAQLIIITNGVKEQRNLVLGELDPIETVTGAKDRLANLGYDGGAADDEITEKFKEVLKTFQEDYQLSVSGEYDDATQQQLKKVHGF
jgi:hypothetical protein